MRGQITLIDASGAIAAGKALDILQSGPIAGIDVRVSGATDVLPPAGAAVVVIADGAGAEGEWRGDAGLDLLRRLQHIAPERAARVCGRACYGTSWPSHIASCASLADASIGSAPGALVSAARAMVAVGAALLRR